MLSTKRDRFIWSKQDRLPEASLFRLLRQHWHPTTRVFVADETFVTARGRHRSSIGTSSARGAKSSWTPWLWVGS
jgi:hypothetical protein